MTEPPEPFELDSRSRLVDKAQAILGAGIVDTDKTEFEIGLPEPVSIEEAHVKFRPVLRVLCYNAGVRVPFRIARSFFPVPERSAGTYMSQMVHIYDNDETGEGSFLRKILQFEGRSYRQVVRAGVITEDSARWATAREEMLGTINERLITLSLQERSESRQHSRW